MKTLPKWLDGKINSQEISSIENEIYNAETKTSCEIVTMIVRSSSVTYKALKMCIALSVVFGVISYNPLFLVLAFFIYFAERKIQKHNCVLRANNEFYKNGLLNTVNKTGVFIFVSLEEKQTVVLADSGVYDFLEKDVLTRQVEEISKSIQKNQMAKGICQSIKELSSYCLEIAPRVSSDLNELGNEVIIKE